MSSIKQQLTATSVHKFPAAAARHQHQVQHHEPGCGFCKRNREPSQVYLSHKLKDESGKVTCPQLSRHICELCGATGPEAHTRSYCPQVVRLREQQKARERERKNSVNSSTSSGLSGASEPRRGPQAGLAHNNNNSTSKAINNEPTKGLSVSNAAGNEDEDREEEEEDYTIQCGVARVMSNMGTVSHTRYNSAGRLRNPHKFKSQQANNNDPSRNYRHRQSSYHPHGHQQSHHAPGGGSSGSSGSWRMESSNNFEKFRQ